MTKWKPEQTNETRQTFTAGSPKQITLEVSAEDYTTLEQIINAPDSVFKTVENYLLFMVQNRVQKARQ
jgi:hypothetical protein